VDTRFSFMCKTSVLLDLYGLAAGEKFLTAIYRGRSTQWNKFSLQSAGRP